MYRVYPKALSYIYLKFHHIKSLYLLKICNRYNKVLLALNKPRYNRIIILNTDDSKELITNQSRQAIWRQRHSIFTRYTYTHIYPYRHRDLTVFLLEFKMAALSFLFFPSSSGIRCKFLRFPDRSFTSQRHRKRNTNSF